MFRKKSHITRSVIATIAAISAIYFYVAITLLRANNDNITFIEKELLGLDDYKKVFPIYLELYQNDDSGEAINKLLALRLKSGVAIWNKAKMALQTLNSKTDVPKIFRDLIRDIGDQSNLILDPSLESYYTIRIMVNYLPRFTAYALYPKNNTYYFEDLDHAILILSQYNPATGRELVENIMQIKGYVTQPENTRRSKLDFLARLQSISETTTHSLYQLLQKRLVEQKQQRLAPLAIIIGLYIALIFLIIFAVRNYVRKLDVDSAREREKLILTLAEKNDELETFTYATAHDLREPVRTIRCYTSLLKKEVGQELGASATEYAAVIDRTSKRAEQMINELLKYATLNEMSLVPERCDCSEEISAVLEDLKSTIETAKPIIVIGQMPIIQTVPGLFRRVMLNFVDNAIKYREKNSIPEVHIDAKPQDNGWLFSISDNGIGIDAAHIYTVFEPFRRLYPEEYDYGQGIGLTSCKKIIEMLGGKIWLTSELGIGTTVYFIIPTTGEL